jgi:uncharacterized SAM-binding protein YcdF (DUF218 family)
MFLIKSLVGALAEPLTIALLLALAALVFRLTSRRKLSAALLLTAVAVAYLGSTSLVGNALLVPLETRYAPLREATISPSQVAAIVVLGSFYEPRNTGPITSLFDDEGLSRISEGVRLALRFPSARLVVSGGAPPPQTAPALGYARFAGEFGIPPERIVVLDRARDTAQEAQAIAALLGTRSFILVTSANHVPRSMALMRRAGANAIPASTSFFTRGHVVADGIEVFLPGSFGLRQTERALHEYLGLAALSIGLQ